jgi:hypothetical protein
VAVKKGAAAILVVALALRLAWPLADPPQNISWSSGIWTDPPAITLPARYAVEEGDCTKVPLAARFVYPHLNGAARFVWELFGVGRVSGVVLAALIGTAAVLVLAAAVRRRCGDSAALLTLGLGAVSFWLVTYSRVLLAEGIVVFLLASSAYFALGSRPKSSCSPARSHKWPRSSGSFTRSRFYRGSCSSRHCAPGAFAPSFR